MPPSSPTPTRFTDADIAALHHLVPLNTLGAEAFEELLPDLQIVAARKGDILFQEGATEQANFYLLDGQLALISGGQRQDSLSHAQEQARYPVAHVLPRKHTVQALTAARVAKVDSRRISELLARSNSVDYQVDDVEEGDAGDWMTLMLRSPVLQQVPASNIQRVMMSVEQVELAADTLIIQQGDPGDYYYMLTAGQAVVRRDHGDGEGEQELARLGPGDGFGEEALLSNKPRNSSVQMLSAGAVLRLAKSDFVDLIQTPLSNRITYENATEAVAKGAVWLDLRPQSDYEAGHIADSINLPIESLRYDLDSLARDRHYVLCSNSGQRAAVGAFLMLERGFDISVLQGGLDQIPDLNPTQQADEPELASDVAASDRPSDVEAEARIAQLEQALQKAKSALDTQHANYLQKLKAMQQQLAEAQQSEQASAAQLAALQKQLADTPEPGLGNPDWEAEKADLQATERRLTKRVDKLERELIGEKEQAESANSMLEELEEKLDDVKKEREQDRRRHAESLGQLKETITELQLELDQAKSELADHAKSA